MIKLFASDLDGTLLGANHQISPRTAQAITNMQNKGIEFIVATGRDRYSTQKLLEAANIKCCTINHNGGAIYNLSGEIIFSQPLDSHSQSIILEDLNQRKMEYSIMGEHNFYVADVQAFYERVSHYISQNIHKSSGEDTTNAQLADQFGNIKSLADLNLGEDTIYKIMAMSGQPHELSNFKKIWEHHPTIDITSSGKDNIEITHKKAQKGIAIQKYIQNKGFSMNEVATIGDSLNDRSMLKMAGYSYAMSNASDQVKSLAKFIAPPNNEEGVAQIIESILENNKEH